MGVCFAEEVNYFAETQSFFRDGARNMRKGFVTEEGIGYNRSMTVRRVREWYQQCAPRGSMEWKAIWLL